MAARVALEPARGADQEPPPLTWLCMLCLCAIRRAPTLASRLLSRCVPNAWLVAALRPPSIPGCRRTRARVGVWVGQLGAVSGGRPAAPGSDDRPTVSARPPAARGWLPGAFGYVRADQSSCPSWTAPGAQTGSAEGNATSRRAHEALAERKEAFRSGVDPRGSAVQWGGAGSGICTFKGGASAVRERGGRRPVPDTP